MFDKQRALNLRKRLLVLCLDIGYPPEDYAELIISNWGYFAALDRIKELEDYIVTRYAYGMIANYEGTCTHETSYGDEGCPIDCENEFESCLDLEMIKKQAREELEKEGVL